MKQLILSLLILPCFLSAGEWPTYQYNFQRSGVSKESLSSKLKLNWQRLSKSAPQTAWSGPAKWDAYAQNSGLQSLRNFDPAFFVTGSQGNAYFGSSVDNAIHCLDTKSGKEKWLFFTNGPVRFPPTIVKDKLYFGSDDGFVYCISTSGKLIWKYQAVAKGRIIASNGKLISTWPIRSGTVVNQGKVWFAASLVPWEPSYVCCVDATTGKEIYKTEHQNITLEGAILAAGKTLIIPQGRAAALLFEQNSGKNSGHLKNAGSTFIILTDDNKVISGPRNQSAKNNILHISDVSKKINMAVLDGTEKMIIDGDLAWYHKHGHIYCMNRVNYTNKSYQGAQVVKQSQALQRNIKKITTSKKEATKQSLAGIETKLKAENTKLKKLQTQLKGINGDIAKTTIWKTLASIPLSFIKVGDQLVCGMENEVKIFNAKTDKLVWSHAVSGKALGLASWDNMLYISTDEGHIYAFGASR